MKKFFQEFKEFAMRGNVLDMAVGVVVGSAFTAIVTSIVQNLLTPLLGLLIPDSTFAEWAPGGFGIGAVKPDAYPYPGEQYILEVNRFQIEVMRNLDQCPAVGAMIVCAFPKLKDGVGFPARCFAICPAE